MVASKSSKTTKYTYAERVLGAFTTVQKEHRRHAVHMATLRAQVKRTAQAKQDKLGPQWSNWVGKAVHRLADEGIFESSEPSGSLMLTPTGKKAIAAARQSLSIPRHATPTPMEEDLIWKQVTQPTTTLTVSRGTKRARRSSVLPLSKNEFRGEKRPRISILSDSRINKRVAKLPQKAREEALWRETSPLTDLDDDDAEEIARLKDKLEQQEREITEMRRALALTRGEPEGDGSPRPGPVTASLVVRSLHGVTRTQSGSFISTLSKRPTPEPSTPQASSPVGDRMSPIIPTADMPDHDTQGSVDKMTELEHALAARVMDVKRLEDQLLELQTECSTAVQNLAQSGARIKALEAEILTVENQALELRATNSNLEVSFASRVDEHDRIIQERNAAVAALESEKEKYITQLTDMQSALSQAEATVASHVAQALITKNEAEALRSALEAAEVCNAALADKGKATDAELQMHLNNISQLNGKIEELQAYRDRTVDAVARMSAENASVSESLQTVEASNKHLSSQLSGTTNEKAILELALATSKRDVLQREETVEKLSEGLAQARGQISSLGDEIDTMKLRIASLDKDLSISKKSGKELTTQLAAIGQERADLVTQLENSKKTISDMTSSFQEMEKRLSAAESAARKFQAEVNVHQAEAGDLRLKLTAAQNEVSTATERLSTAQTTHAQELAKQASAISDLEQRLESTQAELESQLQKQGGQLAEATLNLEAEQKRSSDLETNLQTAAGRIQDFEEELSDIKESKEADERTIQNLKETFSALRETQMRSLAELGNKVVSAHSSPTPIRRSARNAGKSLPLKLTST